MANATNIGVDLGSLGWRAAGVIGGQVVSISPDEKKMPPDNWLLCEPSPTSGLGVSFPSLKSKIGTGARIPVAGGTRAPEEILADEFRNLRLAIGNDRAQMAGQVVVSVPASYSASRRAALRDAALIAGFTDAHLLNDSMAAVIAYTNQNKQSATALVYSMGYAGFELGLVRAARGRYRALGYEAGDAPGGAAWDEVIMGSWLVTLFAALSERNLVLNPHPREWNAEIWMHVRLAAQQVKETLSAAGAVTFPIGVRNSLQPLSVEFPRPLFEEAIAPSVNATLDLAEQMLREAGLSPGALDAVLLVGGSAHIPLIHSLTETRFGQKPVELKEDALAKGAALYAMRLETASLHAAQLGEEVEEPAELSEIPTQEVTIAATVTALKAEPAATLKEAILAAVPSTESRLAPPSPQLDVTAANGETVIQHAQYLIKQGERSQAEAFLEKVIKDAQGLLDSLRRGFSPTSNRSAERAIAKAYRLLKEGKYDEAVPQSHTAWQFAPDSPEIFDKMIDIHCQAGMAMTRVEDYERAQRWLQCAHSHDQGNMKIQQTLAERHYVQAKQLMERGRRKEAAAAVEQCLYWNPEHGKAIELSAALSKV